MQERSISTLAIEFASWIRGFGCQLSKEQQGPGTKARLGEGCGADTSGDGVCGRERKGPSPGKRAPEEQVQRSPSHSPRPRNCTSPSPIKDAHLDLKFQRRRNAGHRSCSRALLAAVHGPASLSLVPELFIPSSCAPLSLCNGTAEWESRAGCPPGVPGTRRPAAPRCPACHSSLPLQLSLPLAGRTPAPRGPQSQPPASAGITCGPAHLERRQWVFPRGRGPLGNLHCRPYAIPPPPEYTRLRVPGRQRFLEPLRAWHPPQRVSARAATLHWKQR